MEDIKTFIEDFLKAEASASDASVKPDLEDYNGKLEFMNNFCVGELKNKFGMLPQTKLETKAFYKQWHDAGPTNFRHLYKISQYKENTYGNVYLVYTSQSAPRARIFSYGECLFISGIANELKIIKKYSFGNELLAKDRFQHGIGVQDVSFENLGKPIAIERYIEPKHDKDGMEHYNKDI